MKIKLELFGEGECSNCGLRVYFSAMTKTLPQDVSINNLLSCSSNLKDWAIIERVGKKARVLVCPKCSGDNENG